MHLIEYLLRLCLIFSIQIACNVRVQRLTLSELSLLSPTLEFHIMHLIYMFLILALDLVSFI